MPMKLSVVHSGYFKLDGGAMFGIVPKSIWNRINPADEKNMCTWALRCLLVEDGNRKILIDTGMGNKQNEKFFSFFYPHGEETLLGSIRTYLDPEEITDVFITHLHFDHVGGAVSKNSKGDFFPTFPNATYWSNEQHYKWALEANPREAASFLKENFEPLKEAGVLKMIDVEQDVNFTDNITVQFSYGHTDAMMIPYIHMPDGKTIVFAADLMPSSGHIRMPYIMAYDIRPMETLKERSALYERITDDKHILFFEHDKDHECGKVIKNEKGRFQPETLGSLDELLML